MDLLPLSIVIPTYDELENVNILVPRIEDRFSDIRHEIIVVDDSSPDGTGAAVLALNERYGNIRLLARAEREGIGAALRDGLDCAAGEVIISSDADLSFTVEDMRRLYDTINEGYDLVIGSRHGVVGGSYQMQSFIIRVKGIASKIGNAVLRRLAGMRVHDFSANFRAIRKTAWKAIETEEKTNVFLFEMIIKAKHSGARITEIPVSFSERVHGRSKLRLFRELPRAVLRSMFYTLKYR